MVGYSKVEWMGPANNNTDKFIRKCRQIDAIRDAPSDSTLCMQSLV